MKAVPCRDFTGPEHLELGEAPDPAPADDEIMIDVHAASVTYKDHLLVSGGYQMRPPTPFVSWSMTRMKDPPSPPCICYRPSSTTRKPNA